MSLGFMGAIMTSQNQNWEDLIARLERDRRRQGFVDSLIYGAPAITILGSFVSVWLFGYDFWLSQVLPWVGHAALLLSIIAIFLLGSRRKNFLNRFYFGPQSEPSEEEKANIAERDREQKELDWLTRPITWSYFASFYAAMIIVVQWLESKIDMTIEVGIVLFLLGTIAALGLWGTFRVTKFYRARTSPAMLDAS
jgi:hypothetical protein